MTVERGEYMHKEEMWREERRRREMWYEIHVMDRATSLQHAATRRECTMVLATTVHKKIEVLY